MKVTQPDSRTIRVQDDSGVSFRVPYRFFWNGHERQAESIVLTTGNAKGSASDVRAFFLFGEVRDTITQDAAGIMLRRTWSVKTPGSVHLCIDVEFDAPADLRSLFPGLYAGQGLPTAPLSFLGEKTSYPAALLLALGKKGALVFSRTTANEGAAVGIGIERADVDDEPSLLHVQVRFPGIEQPLSQVGPGPQQVESTANVVIESPGSLERSHEVFFSFASRDDIHIKGAAAVSARFLQGPSKKSLPEAAVDVSALRDALQSLLGTHLCQKGGAVGMEELAGGPWISSTAGLGFALAIRRIFPSDGRMSELALRLADFSLKGQLPAGFFFESYHRESGEWRGVRGSPEVTLLSTAHSSRIAELLLLLAADLEAAHLPHEKYFLAGLRFVDFFLDEKARLLDPGSLQPPRERTPTPPSVHAFGGLELFFPLALVHAATGRDRYKKALDLLVKRFSATPWDAFQPPCSREGRSPDARAALAAARLFVRMRGMGFKPVEPPVSTAAAAKARAAESTRLFASLLVPWVRLHGDLAEGGPAWSGCLADSFHRQRLLPAGHETALLLLRLAALTPETAAKSLLKGLARLCRDSARLSPIGTSFYQHTRWDENGKPEQGKGRRGPLDARRAAEEILAALEIARDFPKL